MTPESQIIVYSPNVNLTEKKSSLNNNIQEVVTVSDISGYEVDSNGNYIAANNSDNIISVGNDESHLIDNFSGMLIVNDHYDGGVELWIAGGGDAIMVSHTTAAPGNSTLTMNSNGYEWTNVDNLNGPFTFTVIKTRQGS